MPATETYTNTSTELAMEVKERLTAVLWQQYATDHWRRSRRKKSQRRRRILIRRLRSLNEATQRFCIKLVRECHGSAVKVKEREEAAIEANLNNRLMRPNAATQRVYIKLVRECDGSTVKIKARGEAAIEAYLNTPIEKPQRSNAEIYC